MNQIATRGLLASGTREFLVPQSLSHSPREQKPIQRTLIFSQHTVRSTCCEPNAHQTELTSAVTSDRIYEIKRLLLTTVPDDLH